MGRVVNDWHIVLNNLLAFSPHRKVEVVFVRFCNRAMDVVHEMRAEVKHGQE